MADDTAQGDVGRPRRISWLAALPLAVFAVLAGIFAWQLLFGDPPDRLPSALIGRPAPQMEMPPLEGLTGPGGQLPGVTGTTLDGRVSIVNVWASWCAPCRAEHPYLMRLAGNERVQMVGLNYKDRTANALRFLGQLGNPFTAVGIDPRGKAAIEWGVYGVPETYIVGADGIIAHKHVGPLDENSMTESFLPALEKVLAEAGGETAPAAQAE